MDGSSGGRWGGSPSIDERQPGNGLRPEHRVPCITARLIRGDAVARLLAATSARHLRSPDSWLLRSFDAPRARPVVLTAVRDPLAVPAGRAS